ncbi:MAG TPA: hypothetical protein VGO59_12025 [Verrucomicrobiae bacterium]|jgi:hypothetical protein
MKNTQSPSSITLETVLQAVHECRHKPLGDPQRIIVLLAPSGSSLPLPTLQELRKLGAMLVQAGQLDFDRVKFLKMLANRTRVVPLLFVAADFWRGWSMRHPIEAAQIHRRTYLVIDLGESSPAQNVQPAGEAAEQEEAA